MVSSRVLRKVPTEHLTSFFFFFFFVVVVVVVVITRNDLNGGHPW